MILAPIACEVKAVEITFAPLVIDHADANLLDLSADFGPADDDAQWDVWAEEAAAQNRLDLGLSW